MKDNRGGKRNNAGRPRSPYQRKVISFNVRVEFEPTLRKLVKDAYEKWKDEN
jgi:hypothetical protein